MNENAPHQEILSAFDMIAKTLAEKGMDDPEAIRLLSVWTKSMEEQVTNALLPDQALLQVEFERQRGLLYIQAVSYEEARKAWNGALTLAILAE